jgi:hypothetical protein
MARKHAGVQNLSQDTRQHKVFVLKILVSIKFMFSKHRNVHNCAYLMSNTSSLCFCHTPKEVKENALGLRFKVRSSGV